MIERWLIAVRDHPERPPVLQRHVLTMLALRMNWITGRGYASTGQLAADSDAEQRTVRRATRWARDHDLLTQTRRGHYINAETVIASEWQLTQPVTGDLLEKKPTGQNGQANRTAGEANRSAAHHHQETVFHQELSSSARGPASPMASPRERLEDPARLNVGAIVKPRSEACKAGEHKRCPYDWCTCACGHRGRQL